MSTTSSDALANEARDRVLASLKIVGSACFIHPERMFCQCPVAAKDIPRLNPKVNKRVWYCLPLEELLLSKQHAWNYTGDKATHDQFVAAEGMTPKHFIRQHLQTHILTKDTLAPSSKLIVTIKASLDFWLARNKQWREKYGDRETAWEKWPQDEYEQFATDSTNSRSSALGGFEDEPEVGQVYKHMVRVPCVVRTMGRDSHRFKVLLAKLHPSDVNGSTPYGVCVDRIEWCHKECKIAQRMMEEELPRVARSVLKQLDSLQGEKTYGIARRV